MFEFICVYALLSLAYLLWSTTVATTKKTVVWLKIVLKVMPIVSLQCYVLKQLSLGGDTWHIMSIYLLRYYFSPLEMFY